MRTHKNTPFYEVQSISFYLIKSKGNFYKQNIMPLRKSAFLHSKSECK